VREVPYAVAEAAGTPAVGLRQPLDRPWLHARGVTAVCCGARLALEGVAFTFESGATLSLFLAQCSTCGAVYWREAPG
jgi:hypothetical protein